MGTTTRSSSRRATLIAATVLMATLLTLVASPAPADNLGVSVTARIAPSFELTMLTDGQVDFGDLAIGSTYRSDDVQRFRVKSARPWDLSDSSDTVIVVADRSIPRERIIRHEITPGFGPSQAAGVQEFDIRYTVDLTVPEALDLPAGALISTRFSYTCVQQ